MKRALALVAALAATAGCSGGGTTAAAPAPTVTVTQEVPGPTVTVTETEEVPGPTVTVTETEEVPGPTRTVTERPSAPAPPPPEPEEPTAAGLSDGSFTGTKPRGLRTQFGTCQATARVTNTSDSEKTAVVTYTAFKGGQQVTTLQGTVNQVGAGDTATVTLLSQDPCPSGSLRYEFQVDAEF